MRGSRREFLNAIAAVLAAPAVVEEGAVMRFFRSLKGKALRYKRPVQITDVKYTTVKHMTPVEWKAFRGSPEMNSILDKMQEDIDRITKQMIYESNRWMVGDKSVPGYKPQKVEVDPPWLDTRFGKEQ